VIPDSESVPPGSLAGGANARRGRLASQRRLPGSHALRRLLCMPVTQDAPQIPGRPAGPAGTACDGSLVQGRVALTLCPAGPAADGRRRPGAVRGRVQRVRGPAGGARGDAGAVDAAAGRGLRAESRGRAGVGALPAPGARPAPPARRRAPGEPPEPRGRRPQRGERPACPSSLRRPTGSCDSRSACCTNSALRNTGHRVRSGSPRRGVLSQPLRAAHPARTAALVRAAAQAARRAPGAAPAGGASGCPLSHGAPRAGLAT